MEQLLRVVFIYRGPFKRESRRYTIKFNHNLPQHRVGKGKSRTKHPQRPYDPKLDGWNIHIPRHEPALSQLLYREDDHAADMLEFLD